MTGFDITNVVWPTREEWEKGAGPDFIAALSDMARENAALKARLALAEAVCELEMEEHSGRNAEPDCPTCIAIAAWRASKSEDTR